jgi:hypothetical protein
LSDFRPLEKYKRSLTPDFSLQQTLTMGLENEAVYIIQNVAGGTAIDLDTVTPDDGQTSAFPLTHLSLSSWAF